MRGGPFPGEEQARPALPPTQLRPLSPRPRVLRIFSEGETQMESRFTQVQAVRCAAPTSPPPRVSFCGPGTGVRPRTAAGWGPGAPFSSECCRLPAGSRFYCNRPGVTAALSARTCSTDSQDGVAGGGPGLAPSPQRPGRADPSPPHTSPVGSFHCLVCAGGKRHPVIQSVSLPEE